MTVRISKRRVDMNGVQLRLSKGADVASATALALGTDGNYFDVTGTTTITSIGAITTGTVVRLHFDGALTLTHHVTNLILPSAANITTATGDNAEFTEYATGVWRCTNYTKASGEAVVGGGSGAWTLIDTQAETDGAGGASLTITGLSGDNYECYAIVLSGFQPVNDQADLWLRTGSGSISTSGYNNQGAENGASTSGLTSAIDCISSVRSSTDGTGVGIAYLHPMRYDGVTAIHGDFYSPSSANIRSIFGGALPAAAGDTADRIQVLFDTGNIKYGRMTVFGIMGHVA